jgi:phage host-nuclease inhibitor protein Gam
MAKRLKHTDLTVAEIQRASDVALADIAECARRIAVLEAEAEQSIKVVRGNYAAMIEPLQAQIEQNAAWLKDTMKGNKAVIFDGTDVVNLAHGSLIRSLADKVTIPRDALAKCEEQGLDEAIKTVKTLIREVVEKWPDERLALIGAVKKPKEEFSYTLKEEKP